MAVNRYYSSTAVPTALSAPITDSATSMTVDSVAGFPVTYPYTLSIDAETASKELVTVTNAAGTVLTVTRGVDGTSGQAHSLGAVVRHDHSARDFREPQEHIAASTGVHGLSGALVGLSDAQALTNKDLTDVSNTFPASFATLSGAQTLTNKTFALASNTLSGTLAQFNTALTGADFASLAGAETLTNKTFALGSNTLSGTLAEFNAALSGADFATLAGTETLTGKTLTSPTITDPTITGGADIDGGLTLDALTLDGQAIGVYQTYAPTITGVAATVDYAKWTRIGPGHIVGTVVLTFTGDPTAPVTVTLPTEIEIAFAKPVVVGSAALVDATTELAYPASPVVFNGFGDDVAYFAWTGATDAAYVSAGQGWAADDILTIQFSYPAAP